MKAVFADTVGFLAMWDASDQWHDLAEEAFSRITAARLRVFTTTFVLLECANAAARRPYRLQVDVLRNRMESKGVLIRPTEADWREAWGAYARGGVGTAGIVDHISFIVMRRLGIQSAFTNDRHFREAGFETMF